MTFVPGLVTRICVSCISDNVLDHAIIIAIQLMPLHEIII